MKSKIEAHINTYYTTVLSDMLKALDCGTPGKRQWCLSDRPGETFDYRSTTRSTFPCWSKFFHEKTPKSKFLHYCVVDGKLPYEDGYFNGNTKELTRLLRNSLKGTLSKYPRIISAWDISVQGYLSDIRDIEEQYNESYYNF